jgi:hypothetical protein
MIEPCSSNERKSAFVHQPGSKVTDSGRADNRTGGAPPVLFTPGDLPFLGRPISWRK